MKGASKMKLIDRTELLNKLDKMLGYAQDNYKTRNPYNSLLQVEDAILDCELIKAEIARHGHWIEYTKPHYFKCSECEHIVLYRKAVSVNGEREYDCCPKCGVKMDLEI